jgi:hypothetical protein
MRTPLAAMSASRSSETVPRRIDLVAYQGDTFVRTLRIRALCSDGTEPIDVGTWLWLGQIRTDYADLEPEVAATFDIAPADPSMVVLSLNDAAMSALSPSGHYVYDIQAQTTETVPRTITFIGGSFKLAPEVSRA